MEEANKDSDSTVNEISYGPGIVQKLCARFAQLSKELNAAPSLRSPRFKRRKSSAENHFTVISEIRRCTVSKPTNKLLLNDAKSSMNSCDGQKRELHFVPPMKVVDTAELNGTYLYHATVIPGDIKANRKAKKIESIREKFEKISATSSTISRKKLNKVRFRRGCSLPTVNTEFPNGEPELVDAQKQIWKAQHDESFEIERNNRDIQLPVLSDTARMVIKLAPPDDNLTVTELSAVPSVSSLSNFEHFQQEEENDQIEKPEKEVNDESGLERSFQFEDISSTSIATNSSVKMPAGRQREQVGLQEVHRLLKKFNEIREQRAKKGIHKDMTSKKGNQYDTEEDHDLWMRVQVNPSYDLNIAVSKNLLLISSFIEKYE
ncbi:hypothetical protein LOAG_10952 [Loa loa]|uniref:Uncharacterized protein n=1 Tax=Loa loa TaxID=7209 RepID=A0A1S0TNX3_LOALO|nr:hypothetical protein LOAG_10952 [Loa loa]EFO17547.2 hypothetical protein LOAG_10952 [Loa loa]